MTDYDARQRIITELASSGGLSADRVATEVLFYLPPDFLAAYEELYWATFKPQGSVPVGTRGGGIGKDALAGTEGADKTKGQRKGTPEHVASGGGKKYKEFWVIISDKNYRKKLRIDAELKRLAGLIKSHTAGVGGGEGAGNPTCPGCHTFVSRVANFCSRCGHELQQQLRSAGKGPKQRR